MHKMFILFILGLTFTGNTEEKSIIIPGGWTISWFSSKEEAAKYAPSLWNATLKKYHGKKVSVTVHKINYKQHTNNKGKVYYNAQKEYMYKYEPYRELTKEEELKKAIFDSLIKMAIPDEKKLAEVILKKFKGKVAGTISGLAPLNYAKALMEVFNRVEKVRYHLKNRLGTPTDEWVEKLDFLSVDLKKQTSNSWSMYKKMSTEDQKIYSKSFNVDKYLLKAKELLKLNKVSEALIYLKTAYALGEVNVLPQIQQLEQQ